MKTFINMTVQEKIQNGFVLDLNLLKQGKPGTKTGNFTQIDTDKEELALRRKLESLETQKANQEKIRQHQEEKKIAEIQKYMSED